MASSSSEESEERSSFSIPAVGKTAFRLSLFSVNSEAPSISMVKSALDEERFLEDIDENDGKKAFRFDIPNLRGFNSPNVKLDADISVATESPPNDTKDDIDAIDAIESLDNRDKAEPRPLCLERLECIGKASWFDAFISSILFNPPNESDDSDSFRSDLLEEGLLRRSNNEEVNEWRCRSVLPNGLFILLLGEPSLFRRSLFQTKFSLLIRRILELLCTLGFLFAYELISTEL